MNRLLGHLKFEALFFYLRKNLKVSSDVLVISTLSVKNKNKWACADS